MMHLAVFAKRGPNLHMAVAGGNESSTHVVGLEREFKTNGRDEVTQEASYNRMSGVGVGSQDVRDECAP